MLDFMYKQNETQEIVARFQAGEKNVAALARELGETSSFVRGALAVYGFLEPPTHPGRQAKKPKRALDSYRLPSLGRPKIAVNPADTALLKAFIELVGTREAAARQLRISRASLSRYEHEQISIPLVLAAQLGIRLQLA